MVAEQGVAVDLGLADGAGLGLAAQLDGFFLDFLVLGGGGLWLGVLGGLLGLDLGALDALAETANKHDANVPADQRFFTKEFSLSADEGALSGSWGDSGHGLVQMSAGLRDPKDMKETANAIKYLRSMDHHGLRYVYVAGTPALTQDSIDALLQRLPLMTIILVLVTGFLMFLAFGSIVLPIKAALGFLLSVGAAFGVRIPTISPGFVMRPVTRESPSAILSSEPYDSSMSRRRAGAACVGFAPRRPIVQARGACGECMCAGCRMGGPERRASAALWPPRRASQARLARRPAGRLRLGRIAAIVKRLRAEPAHGGATRHCRSCRPCRH